MTKGDRVEYLLKRGLVGAWSRSGGFVGKVQVVRGQATKAQTGSRCIALLFDQTLALGGVGGQHHVPAALPPGKTRCVLYRRLGELQGRSGEVKKISPPPGFDPRTVQTVASRYTD